MSTYPLFQNFSPWFITAVIAFLILVLILGDTFLNLGENNEAKRWRLVKSFDGLLNWLLLLFGVVMVAGAIYATFKFS